MFRTIVVLLLLAALPAVAQQVTPAAESAATLSLEDVTRQLLDTHPALAAIDRQIAAARLRLGLAAALPDPTVTASYMGSAAPFKTMAMDPSSYRGITAMQMLPLGGKRELRRSLAAVDVKSGEADALAVRRRLKAAAAADYYDYYYATRALEVTAKDKARLEQMVSTTEARYSVGKAMQADVLRAQLEVSMLLQRQAALEEQRASAVGRLNLLMGRSVDAPLAPPSEVLCPALPPLPALVAQAGANDAGLQKNQVMLERNTLAIASAHKDYIPDLSVGYMFQQRSGMADMYGMTFSLNIPVFYKSKQRQAEAAARIDLEATRRDRDARKLELAYDLRQMHAMASTAGKMLDLYDKAILPQAELALESAQSSYSTGGGDFTSTLASFTSILGYQIDYLRQVADYMTALARIEAYTGDLANDAPAANEAQPATEAKQ
ncbi:MAG: TolC family protein [Acidobacteriota bacterium]|nr:TolC family protein [Acidobacteriota bacterium]